MTRGLDAIVSGVDLGQSQLRKLGSRVTLRSDFDTANLSPRMGLLVAYRSALMPRVAFLCSAPLKTVEVDHTRALCIPAGADHFRDIGRPKVSSPRSLLLGSAIWTGRASSRADSKKTEC